MRFRELLLLVAGALIMASSCRGGAGEGDSWRELLAESDRLASLDIMTWRDAQGWEHAAEAERLARAEGIDSLIAISQVYIRKIVASDRRKEQLLRLVSKDLASPQSGRMDPLGGISSMQDKESIRARCQQLLDGEEGVADDIASYIMSLAEERDREVKKLGLTARELEVIHLSREGLSNSAIADRLHVSVYTVKNHKQNIYLKMDVRSNAEMLKAANQLGIV